MKLEKTKKIKKSQLQNQKQIQNVIVNLPQATKSSRKRKPKALQAPSKQGPNKTHFQSPIYMPPVVSYNPKQDNNFLLTEIMKHIKGSSTSTNQPNNQIEKPPAISEEQKALDKIQQVQPSLPQAFNTSAPPNRSLSLVGEMKNETSDTSNDQRTFVKPSATSMVGMQPSQFEATQEQFKFNPLVAEPKESKQESKNLRQDKIFRPVINKPAMDQQ